MRVLMSDSGRGWSGILRFGDDDGVDGGWAVGARSLDGMEIVLVGDCGRLVVFASRKVLRVSLVLLILVVFYLPSLKTWLSLRSCLHNFCW